MTSLDAVCAWMADIAPLRLSESWDNVGLLVGDRSQSVSRIMTCLTVTPDVVDEAAGEDADLIISHHPLPFRPVKQIVSDSITGDMLLRLIRNGIAVYSAHTAFDSADQGINQTWADLLELASVEPLIVIGDETFEMSSPVGSGRCGRLPEPRMLADLVDHAAGIVGATSPRYVGIASQAITRVALACGSGGSFLSAAVERGCDALITGEATFHTCLEARSRGIGLGLLGHYCSERFAMERLAARLQDEMPDLTIWPSRHESDPIVGLGNASNRSSRRSIGEAGSWRPVEKKGGGGFAR